MYIKHFSFFLDKIKSYNIIGDNMKVRIFDEEYEGDLESDINTFLSENFDKNIIDIKYQVATSMYSEEQIYCFSAMIIYK